MKPDWKYAPKWAQWLAMDEDGTWAWYEFKPVAIGEMFVCDEGRYEDAYIPDPNAFKNSLEPRP